MWEWKEGHHKAWWLVEPEYKKESHEQKLKRMDISRKEQNSFSRLH